MESAEVRSPSVRPTTEQGWRKKEEQRERASGVSEGEGGRTKEGDATEGRRRGDRPRARSIFMGSAQLSSAQRGSEQAHAREIR